MSEPLTAAFTYHKRGFSVIPIQAREKKPLVAWEEYQKRGATEDEIRSWWSNRSDANVGIVTGGISGLVVIDVDSAEAKDKLKELVSGFDFSAVPRSRTGKGWQLFFQHPGYIIPNRLGVIPGLDVRGDGGYVVAPPSIHPNGKPYKWEVPLTDELPNLPLDLFKLISSPTGSNENGYRERFNSAQALAGVPEGQRDETLFKFACTLRSAGVPQDWAERLSLEAAANCQPPFPETEALKKVANAYRRYEPRQTENFTSDYSNPSSEVKFEREINAAVLQAETTAQGIPPVTFKPFLGRDGYVVKGWSHLVAAFPKTGKTEVMVRALADWPDDMVLYVTEEPKSVWQARLLNLPAKFSHVSLFFGLGVQPGEIFERIKSGNETVFILDTIRNLLGLADETDNSAMARALIPYIAVAREQEKTIFFLHHDRKGGGEHGEGIAGAHAFLAVVDIALEIKRDGPEDSRCRLLRGWGRVVEIPRLIYELRDDGSMVALGSPALVTLGEVKNRVWSVLDDEFEKTKSIRGHIDDPKPSEDQLLKALEELAQEGKTERDPPFSEGKRQGARYKWRRSQNLTSDEASYKSEVKFDESDGEKSKWISEL